MAKAKRINTTLSFNIGDVVEIQIKSGPIIYIVLSKKEKFGEYVAILVSKQSYIWQGSFTVLPLLSSEISLLDGTLVIDEQYKVIPQRMKFLRDEEISSKVGVVAPIVVKKANKILAVSFIDELLFGVTGVTDDTESNDKSKKYNEQIKDELAEEIARRKFLKYGEPNRLTISGAEIIEREVFHSAIRLVLKVEDPDF